MIYSRQIFGGKTIFPAPPIKWLFMLISKKTTGPIWFFFYNFLRL